MFVVGWLLWARKYACVCKRAWSFLTLFNSTDCGAHQAPLSMGFSRQEEWSGLPFPPSGDLPDPGTEPLSPMSPARAGGFFTTASPGKLLESMLRIYNELFHLHSKQTCEVGRIFLHISQIRNRRLKGDIICRCSNKS